MLELTGAQQLRLLEHALYFLQDRSNRRLQVRASNTSVAEFAVMTNGQ